MLSRAAHRRGLHTTAWQDSYARLALAFSILSTAGASVALTYRTATLRAPSLLLSANRLVEGIAERTALLAAVCWGALLPLLAALVYLAIRGLRGVPALCRLADMLSPLCLTVVAVGLFDADTWHQRPLHFLLMLAALVLVAERLFARSLVAWSSIWPSELRGDLVSRRLARWLPLLVVVGASLAYAFYFSYYTLQNHRQFGTGDLDLGINVNWCFNALHGNPARTTVLYGTAQQNFFSAHAIFAMVLWLPLFALKPGPEVLLVYQSVMCGLAAIPLYLFAQKLLPRPTAMVIALAYLFFAPLHGPNFYDFHELPVAIIFSFLLYYCIVTHRNVWVWVLVAVIMAHREDMPLGIVGLGAFLLLAGVRPRLGLALATVGATYFVLIRFIVMPYLGTWIFASVYDQLQTPEGKGGFGSIIHTILTNPLYLLTTLLEERKLIYFLHLFAPLVFLPARRPVLWLAALGGFVVTLMATSTKYWTPTSIAFQYTAHWIPYLFGASVVVLRLLSDRLGPTRRRAALLALVLGTLCHSTVFGAVLQREHFVGGFHKIEFEETPEQRARYEAVRAFAAMIPEEASVIASGNVLPHVATHLDVYSLAGPVAADYLLVWKGYVSSQTQVLNKLFQMAPYGLVGQHKRSIYFFKKGLQSPDTARALAELGVAAPPRR